MIPQTFNGWANCIVKDCKINLTKEFAEKRLLVYQNNKNSRNPKIYFALWRATFTNIINWFKKIKND